MSEQKKLNVAIIGQGRSGRDIHGVYFLSDKNVHYQVKYVVELDAARRAIAAEMYPGCTVLEDYRDLYDKSDVDLVVNASFSDLHYPVTKDLLEHGKNVLVEKPFARNHHECATLIQTAKEHGVYLQVFQQTFLAPFYLKTLEVLESGILGKPEQISIHYNGFGRRWDWQTLQKRMGGSVYNTGPHPIGLAMDLLGFGDDIQVAFSRLGCGLTSGDAEDYAKIILVAPNKPVIDLEISSIDAYSDYNLKIQGSKGCFKTTTSSYTMKYIVDGENPERPVQEATLRGENDKPIYCGEKLITHAESADLQGSVFHESVAKFYDDMYYAITEGKAMYTDPEKIMRLIGVIERVHAENPLPLKY